MRRRSKNKFLVSRHGFQNGVGVVGVWGLWELGRKMKRETNGRKDGASVSGEGDEELQTENVFSGIA